MHERPSPPPKNLSEQYFRSTCSRICRACLRMFMQNAAGALFMASCMIKCRQRWRKAGNLAEESFDTAGQRFHRFGSDCLSSLLHVSSPAMVTVTIERERTTGIKATAAPPSLPSSYTGYGGGEIFTDDSAGTRNSGEAK